MLNYIFDHFWVHFNVFDLNRSTFEQERTFGKVGRPSLSPAFYLSSMRKDFVEVTNRGQARLGPSSVGPCLAGPAKRAGEVSFGAHLTRPASARALMASGGRGRGLGEGEGGRRGTADA